MISTAVYSTQHATLIGYALSMQINVIGNETTPNIFGFIKTELFPLKLKVDCITVPHLINWMVMKLLFYAYIRQCTFTSRKEQVALSKTVISTS